MILNLSRKAQREAQGRVLNYMTFNAFGVALTMTSLIPLLALYYEANDFEMGLLYAGIYITGLAALVAPLFLNGQETTRIWRRAWVTRALVGFAYLALPLLPFVELKILGLLVIYYAFMTARAIGISAWYVASKAICPARTMQSFAARNTMRHLFSALPAMALAYFALNSGFFSNEEGAFMLVLGIGGIANFLSYRVLIRMPATGYLTEGTVAGILEAFRIAFRQRPLRKVILFTFLQTVLGISIMYQINYMKIVAGLSSATLFLIIAVSMLAAMVAIYFLKVAGDHVPFRALLFSSHFALLVLGLCWLFIELIPSAGSVLVLGLLYSLSTAALSVSGNVVQRLQTVLLPEPQAYGVSMVYQVATLLGALVATGLVAALAPMTGRAEFTLVHDYSHAFTIWVLMSAGICFLTIVVRSGRQVHFRDDLSFLTPSNLMTIYRVYRAENQAQPTSRQLLMEGAIMVPSRMGQKMILQWANSADISERSRAFRLLNRQPFPNAFDAVRGEATSAGSPLRIEAITTLGYLGNPEAWGDLLNMLGETDSMIRATALKSLYRLGEEVPEETLQEIYASASSSAARVQILAGLASTGKKESLLRILREELPEEPDTYWLSSLFLHTAQAFNRRESMTDIFNVEKESPGRGFEYILTETESALLAGVDPGAVRSLSTEERYHELARLFPGENGKNLLKLSFSRESALGLFFLWTVLREEEEIERKLAKP